MFSLSKVSLNPSPISLEVFSVPSLFLRLSVRLNTAWISGRFLRRHYTALGSSLIQFEVSINLASCVMDKCLMTLPVLLLFLGLVGISRSCLNPVSAHRFTGAVCRLTYSAAVVLNEKTTKVIQAAFQHEQREVYSLCWKG
ncbi:unnamed protein product [Oncorhynchus mykiss]|uniref:Uncharacterized protein n=1 Tax=Oncorhynchus mykiss TaxID=8022 RepID=A0A060X9D1_ONCMY|nr:unnamed protein product [Oncorhynchus mykiss]